MKKVFKVLLFVFLFLGVITVNAETDYTYRTERNNRVKVKINGYDIYMSLNVLFNMSGDNAGVKKPVESFTAEFRDNTFYITVKRSELNKVFQGESYDNVYSLFEISADLMDFKSDKQYFYVFQQDYQSAEGADYSYCPVNRDYLYKNYGILEIVNSPAHLIGYANQASDGFGGGFAVYEVDELPEDFDVFQKYNLSDFSEYTPIIKLDKRKNSITIVEDVRIDVGDTGVIVSENGTRDETTGEGIHEIIEVNNYYAKYFDNNRLSYSWTMFDTEGNPQELTADTFISFDNSENEEEIISLFSKEFSDIKERIKIVSFSHDGDLGGTAKISLYVGDKFEPGSLVTFLHYNPEDNVLENPAFDPLEGEPGEIYSILVDEDGYIAIEITHCSEYVITEDVIAKKVLSSNPVNTKDTGKSYMKRDLIYAISIASIVALICCGFIILTHVKRKNKKQV